MMREAWVSRLSGPGLWRLGLGLYGACLAGLVFVFFVVSAMQVPTALHLTAPDVWVAGERSGVRGHVLDAQRGTWMRALSSADLTLERDGEGPVLLGALRRAKSGLLEAELTVPVGTPPGAYDLVFRTRVSRDAPEFESRASVEVVAPDATSAGELDEAWWPVPSARLPASEREGLRLGYLEGEGEVRVDVLEREPLLPRGLEGEVWVRTSDRATGSPLSCDVAFEEVKGLVEGKSLASGGRTNALGLWRVQLAAVTTHQWRLAASGCAGGAQGRGRVQLGTTPSQVVLSLGAGVVRPGAEVVGSVSSLRREDVLYADLYEGERWVEARSFGTRSHVGGIRLEATRGEGIARVQVYHDVYLQEYAWDVAHVYVSERGDRDEAIEALLRFHVKHGDAHQEEHGRWYRALLEGGMWRTASEAERAALLGALLGALPESFVPPPVRINSFEADQRELDEWKRSIRDELLGLVALAMLLGLGMLSVVVMRGVKQAQQQRALYREIEDEFLADEDGEPGEGSARGPAGAFEAMVWVQGFVVLGTLFLFVACILLLMHHMM